VTLGSRGGRIRCLVVWCGATMALVATGLLTRAAVAGAVAAVGGHRLDAIPFDRTLADLAGTLLLGCAGWLWLVTSYVVLDAARGRTYHRHGRRGMPGGLRRLVLSACGVAVAGSLGQPALAVGHHQHRPHVVVRSPVSGLPLPERAAVTRHRLAASGSPRDEPPGTTVVVARGDTLWSIAARDLPAATPDAVIARRWRSIYAANRARIGPDPDLIVPGLHLRLPGKDRP
jgi:hypothetical protein